MFSGVIVQHSPHKENKFDSCSSPTAEAWAGTKLRLGQSGKEKFSCFETIGKKKNSQCHATWEEKRQLKTDKICPL